MDRFLAQFTNRLEQISGSSQSKRLPASSAPTREQQAWLESRREELRRGLASTPGTPVIRVLSLLLSGRKEWGRLDPKDAALRLAQYAEALGDIPIWAIDEARKVFGRGGWRCVWDGQGELTSAMVVAECRHILLRFDKELRGIEDVLGAEIFDAGTTDTQRAAGVAYWFDEVRPEIRREVGISQKTDEEIAAEAAEQRRCDDRFRDRERVTAAVQGRGQAAWGRIRISDELARQLGLRTPRASEDDEVHFEVGDDQVG